jgi:hypothetical protein
MGNGKVARVVPSGTEKFCGRRTSSLRTSTHWCPTRRKLLSCTAAYSGETIAGARSKFKARSISSRAGSRTRKAPAIAGLRSHSREWVRNTCAPNRGE